MCVSLERERLRERERKGGGEREREREREREKERGERDREREGEREKEKKRKRGKRGERGLPGLAIVSRQAAFSFFCVRKRTTFPPMGRVTVHWGESGLTCMRNGDYHGSIIEADLALGIARALPPPFFYGSLCTVRFQRPLVELILAQIEDSCSVEHQANLVRKSKQPPTDRTPSCSTWPAICDIWLGKRTVPVLAVAEEVAALQRWPRSRSG